MDAATLYTVISVISGPKQMMTQKFPTMTICNQVADDLRKRTSLRTTHYCVKRKPDRNERQAAEQMRRRAAAAAKQKRAMAQNQAKSQQQAQAQTPMGLPREFYSGTAPTRSE